MPTSFLIWVFIASLAAPVFSQGKAGKSVSEPKKAADPELMPKGVFALIPWDKNPDPATWVNPCLEGVVIRMLWKDFNWTRGNYQWGRLDTLFKKAERHGKKIHLMIAPGVFAPKFVFRDNKVSREQFKIPQDYDRDDTSTKGELQTLPLPWDKSYLNYWFEFVDTLAGKFGPNQALAYISVTGPNSHNGEVNLPHEGEDLEKWLQLMNVPGDVLGKQEALKTKMLVAYQKTIAHFDKAFAPYGVYFTLAFPQQALPISAGPSNGKIQESYQDSLASYGAHKHKPYFGLQNNGLSGLLLGEPFKQWLPVRHYAGKILTGFQTRAPGNLYDLDDDNNTDAAPKGSPQREQIMRETLLNGIRYGGRFIEIYENDTLDPSLKGVIAAAAKLLSGEEKDCHCE